MKQLWRQNAQVKSVNKTLESKKSSLDQEKNFKEQKTKRNNEEKENT